MEKDEETNKWLTALRQRDEQLRMKVEEEVKNAALEKRLLELRSVEKVDDYLRWETERDRVLALNLQLQADLEAVRVKYRASKKTRAALGTAYDDCVGCVGALKERIGALDAELATARAAVDGNVVQKVAEMIEVSKMVGE